MQSNNYFTAVGNFIYGCFLFYIELLHCCFPMISCDLFYGFLPARGYASEGYRDRNVSVRHAPVLCQNEES